MRIPFFTQAGGAVRVSAGEARAYLDANRPQARTLLDVRQDFEYAEGHLPGAMHIPLPELSERLGELDPAKPVLTYCRSGKRSLAAANMLAGAGFAEVRSMDGGILAWEGAQAVGPANLGLDALLTAATVADVLASAWGMELALEGFYEDLAGRAADAATADMFRRLAGLEERHRRVLLELFVRQSEGGADAAAFEARGRALVAPGTLEGGVTASEYLGQLQAPQSSGEALELAMAIEAQAFDLYSRRARAEADEELRNAFALLADEERAHLKVLGGFVDGRGRF